LSVSFMGVKNYHPTCFIGRGIPPLWQISGQNAVEELQRDAHWRLQDVAPQVSVVHDR